MAIAISAIIECMLYVFFVLIKTGSK
jgi:hypothetical protein